VQEQEVEVAFAPAAGLRIAWARGAVTPRNDVTFVFLRERFGKGSESTGIWHIYDKGKLLNAHICTTLRSEFILPVQKGTCNFRRFIGLSLHTKYISFQVITSKYCATREQYASSD
jgi:hypothetical protein